MNDEVSSDRTKLLALIGVVLLVGAVVVLLAVPPASGYEFSIYEAYPWYFWAGIVGAIFIGQLVVLRTALADRRRPVDSSVGVLLVLLPLLALTLLPIIRGYPLYNRDDVMTHIGFVRDLPESGVKSSIYPPMHLQVNSLAAATGQPPRVVITLLPVVFSVVFLGGLYLFTSHLFDDSDLALFAVGFSFFPAMSAIHVLAVPFTLSLLLVPLVMFLLIAEQRTQAVPIRAMLPFAILGLLYYHPLTATFVILTSLSYAGIKRIRGLDDPYRAPTTTATLSLVVFGGWYLSFFGIVNRFRRVTLNVLYPQGGDSPLQQTAQTVERTSPELLDLVRIAAVRYGADVLVFGFAVGFLALTVITFWLDDTLPNAYVLLAGALVVIFSGATVLFFVFDFIGGFGRTLGYGRIFALPLAGAFWYRLLRRAERPSVRVGSFVTLSMVLLVMVSLTTASVFASPIAFDGNEQVTAMEIDGTDWTFENRNEDLLIEEVGIKQWRFEHFHTGVNQTSPTVRREGTLPPGNFNYNTNETLGRNYTTDRYLLITRKARQTYPVLFDDYRTLWRYYPSEYNRLETDRTVTRIYDNGEFNTYRIEGTANRTEQGSGS